MKKNKNINVLTTFKMITPQYLKAKDKIGIISTARKISFEEIKPAVKMFNDWGLEVVLGKNLFKEFNQFAGNDKERISGFQQMLDDNSIKAVICARGGYGTVRIIDKIDFTNFKKKPKWIVGFSDATVLHSHINKILDIETLHAAMLLNMPKKWNENNSFITMKKALFGENISYEIHSTKLNRKGKAEGIHTGGNLSVIYSLNGSTSDIDTKNKILFLEDLDEYLYHIDRMIMNLKRSGKLKNIAGLIVGGMTEMKDNKIPFGKTANEIISEAVAEYNYPVCFNFPAGHLDDNRALIMGRKVKLDVSENLTTLKFKD
ncbi:MAG: LD-carboxypeptidase [Bacteroidales bacterium]|nr:LD-carboxypeptidase [Bacteroidales bacterium]